VIYTIILPRYAPVRIDILASISGLIFEEVDKGKVKGRYGDVPVYFIYVYIWL